MFGKGIRVNVLTPEITHAGRIVSPSINVRANVAPSLRDRQRQLVRTAVLNAAAALFAEAGYGKTTMQNIADGAGIGIATLFRHFKTKPAILADLIRFDLEELFAESLIFIQNPPIDPAAGVTAFCQKMATILDKRSKRLGIKPALHPGVSSGKPEMDDVVAFGDTELRRQIGMLLVHYKKQHRIRPEIEIADMTALIFYAYNGHYIDFNFGHIATRGEFELKIGVRIALLFEGWTPG